MSAAQRAQHQDEVAFSDAPDELRLVVVNAACLAALKQKAFGRTRPPGDAVVERDFYDAYQLFQHVPEELLETYERAEGDVRGRVRKAAELLGAGDMETGYAARQMVRLGEASNQQDAELRIIRLSRQFSRRL